MKKFISIVSLILLLTACASEPVIYSNSKQTNDLTDLDYDGVIADRDDCKNTVAGASTNNDGCADIITRPKVTHLVVDFEFDKYTLDGLEIEHVNKVASFMQQNPKINIILIGDTSTEGSDDYNKRLSLKRIVTVYNLLIKMGVNPERIVTETYDNENHIPSDLTGRDSRLIAVVIWPEEQEYRQDWTIYDKANTRIK
jgi:outer membrane protein OmpA-like peptidoglycan-associated protein